MQKDRKDKALQDENRRLREEIRRLKYYDQVTGLFNSEVEDEAK